MYKVGVFPGKFLPAHRGHIASIINAATQCEKLYVVVSDNVAMTKRLCEENNLRLMDLKTRTKWLSIELQNFDHIKVLMLDESDIPEYPNGWGPWAKLLYATIPESFDVIFGGEPEYFDQHQENFPNARYELFDYTRERYPISATLIRSNPICHWDYILGSARAHFAKRILVTGTESCGKTTITKYLGKIYHTSWTEEEGRYYGQRFLGGNEDVYTVKDFECIAFQQFMEDERALRNCNKVVFFDTDATVTQYYLQAYLDGFSPTIETFINPSKYDVVLMFTPDVAWVDDGQRFLSGDELRWKLHNKLKNMYIDRGFNNIIEIGGSYNERLRRAIAIVDEIIG